MVPGDSYLLYPSCVRWQCVGGGVGDELDRLCAGYDRLKWIKLD